MNKEEIIKGWMENYPESSAGNCMKCHALNYDKMEFTFIDEETGDYASINMKKLIHGLNVLVKLIEDGKYHNSMGQIPNVLAVGYNDDSQDHDALVQCAIFGEVRYG